MTKLHNSVKVFRQDQEKLIHRLTIGDQILVISEKHYHYRFGLIHECYTDESLRLYREHCRVATAWCRSNLGMGAMGKAQTVHRGSKEVGYPIAPQWRVIPHVSYHEFHFIDPNQAFMFKLMFG